MRTFLALAAGAAAAAMAGTAVAGAAETHDGGATWSPGYEGASSIAIALDPTTGNEYNNPYVFGSGGDCSFSTTCAATAGRGDDFAAQEFTLSAPAVITGASFTELDLGTTPNFANWGFALADGPGGLPGTFLSAGTDNFTNVQFLGTDSIYNVNQMFFDVGPQALGPGTYWFAIQADSSVFETYLGFGAPAANVPEPATWALALVGLGMAGAALRSRARTIAA